MEEVFSISTRYEAGNRLRALGHISFRPAKRETAELNADGFRVIAVAYKEMPPEQTAYAIADESDLTLLGYIAFLIPKGKRGAGDSRSRQGRGFRQDPYR